MRNDFLVILVFVLLVGLGLFWRTFAALENTIEEKKLREAVTLCRWAIFLILGGMAWFLIDVAYQQELMSQPTPEFVWAILAVVIPFWVYLVTEMKGMKRPLDYLMTCGLSVLIFIVSAIVVAMFGHTTLVSYFVTFIVTIIGIPIAMSVFFGPYGQTSN